MLARDAARYVNAAAVSILLAIGIADSGIYLPWIRIGRICEVPKPTSPRDVLQWFAIAPSLDRQRDEPGNPDDDVPVRS